MPSSRCHRPAVAVARLSGRAGRPWPQRKPWSETRSSDGAGLLRDLPVLAEDARRPRESTPPAPGGSARSPPRRSRAGAGARTARTRGRSCPCPGSRRRPARAGCGAASPARAGGRAASPRGSAAARWRDGRTDPGRATRDSYSAVPSHGRYACTAAAPVSASTAARAARTRPSSAAGCTAPAGASASRRWKEKRRSETIRPRTGSAGCVAHRPKTATSRPDSPAISHTALARRSSDVIGSRWPVAGLKRVKSRMRCCSGLVPVAIVVQTSGESGGTSERSTPERPSRTRRSSSGMAPAAR